MQGSNLRPLPCKTIIDPVPLVELLDPKRHDRAAFVCGEPTLDAYVREQTAQLHLDGLATTRVLVDADGPARVLGCSTQSATQLPLTVLQEADRRRLPRYPMPAVCVDRLAVAAGEQGKRHVIFCWRMPWRIDWVCESN